MAWYKTWWGALIVAFGFVFGVIMVVSILGLLVALNSPESGGSIFSNFAGVAGRILLIVAIGGVIAAKARKKNV